MTSWETFSGLSGNGELVFALSGEVVVVRVDITALGRANIVELDTNFPRYFKLGWWTFIDNTNALGQAATSPVHFIDFVHCRYDPINGSTFFTGGYHGIHYHFFDGVTGTFVVGEV